jgi:hypothetical protein
MRAIPIVTVRSSATSAIGRLITRDLIQRRTGMAALRVGATCLVRDSRRAVVLVSGRAARTVEARCGHQSRKPGGAIRRGRVRFAALVMVGHGLSDHA